MDFGGEFRFNFGDIPTVSNDVTAVVKTGGDKQTADDVHPGLLGEELRLQVKARAALAYSKRVAISFDANVYVEFTVSLISSGTTQIMRGILYGDPIHWVAEDVPLCDGVSLLKARSERASQLRGLIRSASACRPSATCPPLLPHRLV